MQGINFSLFNFLGCENAKVYSHQVLNSVYINVIKKNFMGGNLYRETRETSKYIIKASNCVKQSEEMCILYDVWYYLQASEQIPISFAANQKAQLAAKTVFSLAHRHGDMLREGWKNILDCMMTLYRARLLPHTFTEVEDFLQPDGRIKLIKENKNTDPR